MRAPTTLAGWCLYWCMVVVVVPPMLAVAGLALFALWTLLGF